VSSETFKYKDSSLPIDQRIDDLLSRMSIDEKIAQLGCIWSTDLIREGRFDPDYAISQIPNGIGQVTRIGAATGLRPNESANLMNSIQKVVIERTRLGIPVFIHEESVGGFCHRDATVFPQALGLACSWNPELIEKVAQVIREQMLAVGARLALAPVLDVARDPRWGRVEETYGEDPVLVGTLGTAYIKGLQGDDLAQGVAATGKHFLAYSFSLGGRNWGPVHVGPRELREVYAEPFAAAIRDAGLSVIMNSYASVDGLPCAGSKSILTDLLRKELGFKGSVVADYFSVEMLRSFHKVAADKSEAACIALNAGLDMELPALDCFGEPLKKAIEDGSIKIEVIDAAVRRVLELKFRLGLFENPYVDAEVANSKFQTPEQRQLAYQAAAESVVLLKNDGVLPISKDDVKSIAVIGPVADDKRLLQGDYHYPAHLESLFESQSDTESLGLLSEEPAPTPAGQLNLGNFAPGPYYTPHVTPLQAIRDKHPDIDVIYEKGCDILGDDRSGFAAAVNAASNADVSIVFVGGKSGLKRPATSGEANDATSLSLTGVQADLVRSIAEAAKKLVVVVISGRVHTLEDLVDSTNALIFCVPPGEEGGNAIVDVLFGSVCPSGKLPVSFPRRVGQVPDYFGQRNGGDRAMFFGDYIDSTVDPLFPFGYGLSYTHFEYSQPNIEVGDTTKPTAISFEIKNVGEYTGSEVVQLYCQDVVASVSRPTNMLLGFTKVRLDPGQSKKLTFIVHPSRLAFYNEAMQFVTEPGQYIFRVGSSSVDIRHELDVTLTGGAAYYNQRDIVATTVIVE